MNPRILFVGMTDSVHAARWMRQVADQGWDLRMFPVYAARPSPELRDLTVYGLSLFSPGGMDKSVRYRGLLPIGRGGGRAEKLVFRACPQLWEFSLARLIELIRPDIVHSLEFQHAAYLTLAARARVSRGFPTWIVSNWGSDIYLYGRLEEHRTKIKEVLSGCDYYCCECQRDVRLARDMGLRGKALPPLPNAGGFDLSRVSSLRQAGKVSSRRLILLKGYQGWAGRALTGLRALGLCRDSLKGYQIAIYSATPDVRIAAELFEQDTGIPVRIVPQCPHEEMLSLFGQARIYVGLSISDAISTSLLEAMVMGAFPIQSCTSCADEWIADKKNGLIVPPEDPGPIAEAIRMAVEDDGLVDRAADVNAGLADERLDQATIRPKVIEIYQEILASRRT